MYRVEFSKEELKLFEKHHFKYFNLNPHGAMTDDCVVRAIAAGENVSWEKTLRELTEYTIKYGLMLTTIDLYTIYLKDKGWESFTCNETVGGLAKKIKGSAIVLIDNHLTYINNHYTLDIWDCTANKVNKYWIKKINTAK